MPDSLYFIPILARALGCRPARSALRDAFVEIERLGRHPGYERGLAQFHDFMAQARDAHRRAEQLNRLNEQELAIEAAFGSSTGSEEQRRISLGLSRSSDAWREYELVRGELARDEAAPFRPDIRLVCDGHTVGAVTLSEERPTASIANVVPGGYELLLGTGRVLWDGTLAAADCIWNAAFPGEPVTLAAETEHARRHASREISLLEGELTFRIFPGIETGRLELTWRSPRAPQSGE